MTGGRPTSRGTGRGGGRPGAGGGAGAQEAEPRWSNLQLKVLLHCDMCWAVQHSVYTVLCSSFIRLPTQIECVNE